MTSLKSRLLVFFGAALLAAAGFGAAEALFRRFGPAAAPPPALAPPLRTLAEESDEPLFRVETRRGERVLVQQPTMFQEETHREIPLVKAPGVRRIMVLGESSGQMLGMALREEIARNGLTGSLQVLNCASGAATLEVVERRFHECLRYSPDAVVLYFGHNLFYEDESRSRLAFRLGGLTRHSRLLSYLSGLLPRGRTWDTFYWSERYLRLELFIRELARETRRRGLPAVLCTVPGNLWSYPEIQRADVENPRFVEAVYRHDRGDLRSSERIVRELLRERPAPWWHYTLGDWLYGEGDYEGAREQLIAARDLGGSRTRASTAVNDLIRNLALHEGLSLLDFDQLVSDRAPHRIPGWESFADRQHPAGALTGALGVEGLRLIESLWPGGSAAAIVPAEIPGLLEPGGMAHKLEFFRIHYQADVPWGELLDAVRTRPAELLAAAGSVGEGIREPRGRAEFQLFLAEALWRAGRRREAFQYADRALGTDPGWEEPAFQKGRLFARAGEPKPAAALLRKALALNPSRRDIRFYLECLDGARPIIEPDKPRTPSGRNGPQRI